MLAEGVKNSKKSCVLRIYFKLAFVGEMGESYLDHQFYWAAEKSRNIAARRNKVRKKIADRRKNAKKPQDRDFSWK